MARFLPSCPCVNVLDWIVNFVDGLLSAYVADSTLPEPQFRPRDAAPANELHTPPEDGICGWGAIPAVPHDLRPGDGISRTMRQDARAGS